jgi:predicted DNA-binding transcriptional regulator YafY
LRSFAVDAIENVNLLDDEEALEVSESQLDKLLGAGYGIFSGEITYKAVIRFAPKAARWVSREKWHSDQHGEYECDGSYLLTLPYANETELIMDILRHGADAEIVSPASLRESVRNRLQDAIVRYEQS